MIEKIKASKSEKIIFLFLKMNTEAIIFSTKIKDAILKL